MSLPIYLLCRPLSVPGSMLCDEGEILGASSAPSPRSSSGSAASSVVATSAASWTEPRSATRRQGSDGDYSLEVTRSAASIPARTR